MSVGVDIYLTKAARIHCYSPPLQWIIVNYHRNNTVSFSSKFWSWTRWTLHFILRDAPLPPTLTIDEVGMIYIRVKFKWFISWDLERMFLPQKCNVELVFPEQNLWWRGKRRRFRRSGPWDASHYEKGLFSKIYTDAGSDKIVSHEYHLFISVNCCKSILPSLASKWYKEQVLSILVSWLQAKIPSAMPTQIAGHAWYFKAMQCSWHTAVNTILQKFQI